jgi:branched-chain amino acid transport system ATP-binding protein
MKILKVEGVTKSFEGLVVVDHVSFQVEEGELSSIIGCNGAGKTTLFNILTGRIRPDTGRILLREEEINGLLPHEICRKGVGRSFQVTNIFPRLSTFDNVHVAILSQRRKESNMFHRSEKFLREETDEILASVELQNERDRMAGLLSHGDQRRLEVGIALGTRPSILLLDEPTAGMSPGEGSRIMELIRRLGKERGLTILFIEHDMNVVFGISEKVRVMHQGRMIADGVPEKVRANEEVQKVYLAEEI